MSTLLHTVIESLIKESQNEDPFVAEARAQKLKRRQVRRVPSVLPQSVEAPDAEYLRMQETIARKATEHLSLKRYAAL